MPVDGTTYFATVVRYRHIIFMKLTTSGWEGFQVPVPPKLAEGHSYL
jgi:hypothetical protein